ncbi:MAG: twin-arginine translocation signal domain-containing protein [Actinomycetia bacterium]|nr:twin-arginine translocation signal domain-containing protein [Actinomycetes bacterium]
MSESGDQHDRADGAEEPAGDRRRFLKAAAAAGVGAAVWSEPIVRGVPAYAQGGGSVNGSCSALIIWSSREGRWVNRSWPVDIEKTLTGRRTCPPEGTWVIPVGTCGDLTEDVTITATGSADDYDTNCFTGLPATPNCSGSGATVAISTGVSCTFANVEPWARCDATVSITMAPDAKSFVFVNNSRQGYIGLSFDIVC